MPLACEGLPPGLADVVHRPSTESRGAFRYGRGAGSRAHAVCAPRGMADCRRPSDARRRRERWKLSGNPARHAGRCTAPAPTPHAGPGGGSIHRSGSRARRGLVDSSPVACAERRARWAGNRRRSLDGTSAEHASRRRRNRGALRLGTSVAKHDAWRSSCSRTDAYSWTSARGARTSEPKRRGREAPGSAEFCPFASGETTSNTKNPDE